jgi:hypothetical protein
MIFKRTPSKLPGCRSMSPEDRERTSLGLPPDGSEIDPAELGDLDRHDAPQTKELGLARRRHSAKRFSRKRRSGSV